MAQEEEIIQRFKVENGGVVESLNKHDNAIKQIQASTKSLKESHQEHGSAAEKLGKQMLGLEHHHVSARHAIHLFSEATGVGSGGIMTMVHSMGMMGPVIGAAVGGFVLLKQHLDEQAEAAQKAKEKYEELGERLRKFDEERTKKATVFKYGEEGAKGLDESKAAHDKIAAAQRIMAEASGKTMSDPKTGFFSLAIEKVTQAFRGGGTKTHVMSEAERRQYDEARATIARETERDAASNKDAEKNKAWNDIEFNDRSKIHELETRQVYAHGQSLKIMDEELGILENQLDAKIALANAEDDEVRKEELNKEINKSELELARKKMELEEKRIERAEKLRAISGTPGVFATKQEKETFAEDTRYEKEKREAERIHADTSHLTKNHEDILKKIEMDADNEISQRKASINAMNLRNQGDTYEAEKVMAEQHYNEMLAKDVGNAELQALDDEQFKTEKTKLEIAHNNEVASYTSNLKNESLRIKGDQYGAEREALEEWQRKELELHKDQASQIKALHNQRATDITRREKEEHQKILGGYAVEVTAATLGGGVAGVQRLMQEHAEKQAEYKRTGHDDYAQAEQAAYDAKIHRMKEESDAGLMKKGISFTDLGGAYESFAAGLNKNPMEQKQLDEAKMTNTLLSSMDKALNGTRGGVIIQ